MNVYEDKEIEELIEMEIYDQMFNFEDEDTNIFTIGMNDDDLEDEMADSMFCDLYGGCAGPNCRNWINCHN